ncbi:MAG: TSUP family transporter [Gaiellaceae bacterium]
MSHDPRSGEVAVAPRPRRRPEPTPPPKRPQRGRRLRLGTIGLSGGFLSGLLGVGGGVVMVPLLVLWARFGQREAHAASLGAIIPISAAGVLTYGVAGEVRIGYAVALALGAVLGAQVGARALARASERSLKLAFGGFLVLVAVLMVVTG